MNYSTGLRVATTTAGAFAFAAALLTGCSAAPEPPAPSTVAGEAPSPTPSSTPEPDPLDTVVTLVARPQALELRDADGDVVQSLDYLSDTAAAVSTLTTVLGEHPTVEDDAGSSYELPTTVRRWAGFELREPKYPDAPEPTYPDAAPGPWYPNFRVVFTAPASGGILLATDSGHAAGEPWADFAASLDAIKNGMCEERYGEIVVLPRTYSDGTVEDARNSVEFRPSDDGTIIESVAAPRVIHRDGCA